MILGLTWLSWTLIADSMLSPSGSGIVFTAANSRNVFGLAKNGFFPSSADDAERARRPRPGARRSTSSSASPTCCPPELALDHLGDRVDRGVHLPDRRGVADRLPRLGADAARHPAARHDGRSRRSRSSCRRWWCSGRPGRSSGSGWRSSGSGSSGTRWCGCARAGRLRADRRDLARGLPGRADDPVGDRQLRRRRPDQGAVGLASSSRRSRWRPTSGASAAGPPT